jgi:hypothetical protein
MTDDTVKQDRSHPLSQAHGRELHDCFFGDGGYPRLRRRGAQPLLKMEPDIDLRGLPTKPDFRWEYPLSVLLAKGSDFNLEPFVSGVPVGPLASLPVYASDLNGKYVGKSHAPGLCQHSKSLGRRDERITLGEWLPILIDLELGNRLPYDDPLCSKCGGFAIWRLSDDQLSYYEAAQSLGVYEIPRMLDRYESIEKSKNDDFCRAERVDLLPKLQSLENELVELRSSHVPLQESIDVQMARCRRLMRRVQIRVDTKKISDN